MELIVLVDTEASTSFLQMDWSKRNALEICPRNDTYQVFTAMGSQ